MAGHMWQKQLPTIFSLIAWTSIALSSSLIYLCVIVGEKRRVFLSHLSKKKISMNRYREAAKTISVLFLVFETDTSVKFGQIKSSLFHVFGRYLIKMYSIALYQCFSTVLRLMHLSKKVLRHNQSQRGQEYCLYILLMAFQQNQQHPSWKPLFKISIRKKLKYYS